MALVERGEVTVEGFEFVTEQLVELFPREAKNVMRQSVLEIAGQIRNRMRATAPRRHGILKKAIFAKRSRGKPGLVEAEVRIRHGAGVKHDAYYWHMIEYGTVHSQPQPFAGPAVQAKAKTFQQDLRKVLDKRVVKMLEKRAKKQKLK